MYKILFVLLCIVPGTNVIYCQKDSLPQEKPFEQQDIKDWMAKRKSRTPKPPKNNYLLILPYISNNPTAGFMIGGGLTYTYKPQKTSEYLSLISSSASYSTKKLVNLNIKSNIFVIKDRLLLNGDWRFLINGETTYGLGTARYRPPETDINGPPVKIDSVGQPLRFNHIRLHEMGSWQLFSHFFAGLGFKFDYYYNIDDERAGSGDTSHAHHFQYSREMGFNPKEYKTSGFSVNFVYDSRDNQVNAYKGHYANVNYRFNLKSLGSTQNSTQLLAEYRFFLPLFQKHPQHILAWWLYGDFVTSGVAPYLALPAIGYDLRQRSGRGYRFGQFRGEEMLYGEMEYRFPISMRTGILGGVLFVNSTTTSDEKNKVLLLEYLRLGYGGGLRIMLDKTSRSRLEVDVGLSQGEFGFFLGVQETF